jgi:AAA15 family ATPase/GTPase
MGTRALLLLSGIIFNSYSNPITLVVDELERSLHPSIVEFIVRQFYNKNSTQNRSQLIFTSHCESLLCNVSKRHKRHLSESEDYSLFRRDQIWFINKESDQSSKLVPLLDYKPRKHESVFDGYRQGRYYGIPILSKYELNKQIDIDLNRIDEQSL